MARGFLNISHNFAGESQYIVVEWVKSTAQGTPVVGHVDGDGLGAQDDTDQTQVYYPAAHTNRALQVTELPEVWMVVRFWRSSDGVAKDTLLLELAGNARTGALYPIERFEYVVDRGRNQDTPGFETTGTWSDPVQDDTGLRDTRLENARYWIEERGTGSLIAAEYTDRSDDGGGFDFTEVGKVMNSGAVYVVYVITQIDLAGDDSAGGGGASSDDDIFILDTDQDYNPVTMGGKTLIADFSGAVGTLTLPSLALLADSRFKLQTHQGNQRNVIIQLDVGDTAPFRKDDVNQIILGEGEEIEILIKDNSIYILNANTGHDKLGVVDYGYKQGLNQLIGDGTLLNLADYPRVAELIAALPASSVVNEVTWQTSAVQADGQTAYPNKGKWMLDSGGGTFRAPDLRDRVAKALSATDGSQAAGRYEHQEIMAHDHFITADLDNGGSPYLSNNHSTGGNSGYQFNGSSATPHRYETGSAGGSANKVNNTGFYPLINI